MAGFAVVEHTAREKIGHGLLVAPNLLMTCAHCVGDGDDLRRPHPHPITVTFQNGARAVGHVHDVGWFPEVTKPPLLPADIAILRLDWQSAPADRPQPVVFPESLAPGVEFHLRTTSEQGPLGLVSRVLGKGQDSRSWTAPLLDPVSALRDDCEVFEFTPQDKVHPDTKQGWSGSAVCAVDADGQEHLIGMWNGAPNAERHRGHVIAVAVLRQALAHCLADTWGKPKPWQPHRFNDAVRSHPQPLDVTERVPVTGRLGLARSAETYDRSATALDVRLRTGLAGVCALPIEKAGAVRFGIVSARVTVEGRHMTLTSLNRIAAEGATATAQMETETGGGTQSHEVTYFIRPREAGGVLEGNMLCDDRAPFATLAEGAGRKGANAAPEISGTITAEFSVIDFDHMGAPPPTEDEVRAFKKRLITELLNRHQVNGGVFDLEPLETPDDP